MWAGLILENRSGDWKFGTVQTIWDIPDSVEVSGTNHTSLTSTFPDRKTKQLSDVAVTHHMSAFIPYLTAKAKGNWLKKETHTQHVYILLDLFNRSRYYRMPQLWHSPTDSPQVIFVVPHCCDFAFLTLTIWNCQRKTIIDWLKCCPCPCLGEIKLFLSF